MSIFPVGKDVRIRITSTINAAYKQRFFIEKRFYNDPETQWREMGNHVYYGAQVTPLNFLAASEESFWQIKCENDNGKGSWRSSIQDMKGTGTSQVIIRCDDDKDGDDDYNDLVVTIDIISPRDEKMSQADYDNFDKTALGPNGKIHTGPIVPLDPAPGKGHIPHGIGSPAGNNVLE